MKTKKLLTLIGEYFSGEGRKRTARVQGLRELLRKLRKRREKLEKKLLLTGNEEERNRLDRKLAVLRAQQQKGQELLERLEAE